MKTGVKIAIALVGVAAITTIVILATKKKKPSAQPQITAEELALLANQNNAKQISDTAEKKSDTLKKVAIASGIAGLGVLATSLLVKGKEAKDKKAKGIPVTSTGIKSSMVL